MTTLNEFREIEHTWIRMSDGVRLAARLWVPVDAERAPVPAIFNYCPYFARLFTRPMDDARFPYFAARGYACVRVDIRGSGNSEGLPLDEYVRQEQDDALEIIAWIARQSWCSGRVGMEGISWSGFNSLQVAARQPPALKAVIAHCFTDDRYADDAHYKGGSVIHDMFGWGTVFLAFQGQAPDPEIVGSDGWRERWLERLRAVEFNLGRWLEHPHRDAFWKHASVREDYRAIRCPVYAIGGWVDGYKNPVLRLMAGLDVPRKALIGPWTHIYPHQGVPGPAIGYLDEALRWWDHWLKDANTGIMDEPMLRFWLQDRPVRPASPTVPGRWAAEATWPVPDMGERSLHLTAGQALAEAPGAEAALVLRPLQTVGIAGGNWCPSGAGAAEDLAMEVAGDQRIDDARALTFDSEPLPEGFDLLGSATLRLRVAADRPVAFVAARLNVVSPTGESDRVTYGILNLCHRNGSEYPKALEPGRAYDVRIPLDYAAQRFAPGSRIRISLSSAYWPMVLPAPEPVTLTVFAGASHVTLPVRPARSTDGGLRPFGEAIVPEVAVKGVSGRPGSRKIVLDVATQRLTIDHNVGNGVALLEAVATKLHGDTQIRYEASDHSTDSQFTYRYLMGWERGALKPIVVATSRTRTTRSHYLIEGTLRATDGDELVFSRDWNLEVPRRLA